MSVYELYLELCCYLTSGEAYHLITERLGNSCFFSRVLTPAEEEWYQVALAQLRLNVPLAYITASKSFAGYLFQIDKGCFIPRDDSECLIEAVSKLTFNSEHSKVLDLGTGVGTLALALALRFPKWEVLGVDICKKALSNAAANANRLKAENVSWLESDWFSNLKGSYDLIISNPPYISRETDKYDDSLQYEPVRALFSEAYGLQDLAQIITDAKPFLGQYLVLEHGSSQQEQVVQLGSANGYSLVDTITDLAGRRRGVIFKTLHR